MYTDTTCITFDIGRHILPLYPKTALKKWVNILFLCIMCNPHFDQILAEKKCVLYKRLYGIYKSYPYPMNYNAEFDCVKKRKKIKLFSCQIK